MKHPYINPIPYVPTSLEEAEVCAEVEKRFGQKVLNMWKRGNCPLKKFGLDEQPNCDYTIQTGALLNSLFTGGHILYVYKSGEKIGIEDDGTYI